MSTHQAEAVNRAMKKLEANPLREMPELFNAALDEFCTHSYDDASLNTIIKAVGMNKGSFYYRFRNKHALYIGVFEEIGRQKMEFFALRSHLFDPVPADIFMQFSMMEIAGMQFARREPRYYRFWRRYMVETASFRQSVKEAFPEAGMEVLEAMLDGAIAQGQFRPELTANFIKRVAELLLFNADNLIDVDASDEEIITQLDQLNSVMRLGLGRVKPVEGLS